MAGDEEPTQGGDYRGGAENQEDARGGGGGIGEDPEGDAGIAAVD